MSGTFVVLTEGGGGIALTFIAKQEFTSAALNPSNGRKRYDQGTYTVSGNVVTMVTSHGATGKILLDRNGDLLDEPNNLRFKRLQK